jgi:FtsH-binding integral membrane protein
MNRPSSLANVVTVHWNRIQTKKPGAVYSVVLLVALVATLVLGYAGPASENGRFIFEYILQPLEATFFALLAVFIATAAFRAFRVRDMETFFFVLFAVIVLLGQVPISIFIWPELPVIKDWIINVPTLAGVRGILLGVALGTIATGLRVLIGADRPYTD